VTPTEDSPAVALAAVGEAWPWWCWSSRRFGFFFFFRRRLTTISRWIPSRSVSLLHPGLDLHPERGPLQLPPVVLAILRLAGRRPRRGSCRAG
jgi:hypothetical protein